MNNYSILGCKVTDITANELNKYIYYCVKRGSKEAILNVNINCINIAYEHEWLKKMLNDTNIVFCDGDGVRLGAALLGFKIREKITYNRWIWQLAEFSYQNNLSWFCFGGEEEIIRQAIKKLKTRYPNLDIKGYHHGFIENKEMNELVISRINNVKPNILLIGLGMPLQEKWLLDNLEKIDVNIALTGGAVFDYISGNFPMTPNVFYQLKLEWFYRLLIQPKRLFKRYIIGNPLFFFRIAKEQIKILSNKQM